MFDRVMNTTLDLNEYAVNLAASSLLCLIERIQWIKGREGHLNSREILKLEEKLFIGKSVKNPKTKRKKIFNELFLDQ